MGGAQALLSGWSVAIAQTNPASSRAVATTIFWCGLPRLAIRDQRRCRRCWARQARSSTSGVLAALAGGQLLADAGALALVPGGLDEQPADVAVAGLSDRALGALRAGGAL